MKKYIDAIKRHPVVYSILIVLFVAAIIFFCIFAFKTKDYHDRQANRICVPGTVTASEYKESKSEDENGFTETNIYYWNTAKYEYNGITYSFGYSTDDQKTLGSAVAVYIDATDPAYVFNSGDPGIPFLIFGIIFLIPPIVGLFPNVAAVILAILIYVGSPLGAILFSFGAITYWNNGSIGVGIGFLFASLICTVITFFLYRSFLNKKRNGKKEK